MATSKTGYRAKKSKGIDTSGDVDKLTSSVVDLAKFVEDEFASVASNLQDILQLQISFVAPPKPRQGMVAYADGTHWNPGSGEGLYVYSSGGAWIYLNNVTDVDNFLSTVTQASAFQADKNNVNQTITAGVATKITLTNEIFDIGSNYDAPNSKWTPPAGRVQINAALSIQSTTASFEATLQIRKNGSTFRSLFLDTASGFANPSVGVTDQANGTDFYELYGVANVGTTITVRGGTLETYLSGHLIAPVAS